MQCTQNMILNNKQKSDNPIGRLNKEDILNQ